MTRFQRTMNYETQNYNQIIKQGNLISFPEPEGIPAKYENWVKGRGAHLAPVLMTRLGELINSGEADVLLNSIETAQDFHHALGKKYQVIDLDQNTVSLDNKSVFVYRNTEKVQKELKQFGNPELVGNPPELALGKEILHPDSKGIVDVNKLKSTNEVYGIPTAIGAVCADKNELDRVIKLFREIGKPYIFKDPGGTDGNGITTDISKIEKFPIVIEEKLNFKYTASVQYLNGVLGTLQEREKPEGDGRWRGNSYPFSEKSNGSSNGSDLSKKLEEYAGKFARYLKEISGEDPVIFGLDFAVYEEMGEMKLALIDPNIRMPGNIYLYYHKNLLEEQRFKPKFIETALLYEDQVPKIHGKILQRELDKRDLGLIRYDENGHPIGIKKDKEGNPDGVLVVVQDPGDKDGNNLSMINAFGRDVKRTNDLIKQFSLI